MDEELVAMGDVAKALEAVSDEGARRRVVSWAWERYVGTVRPGQASETQASGPQTDLGALVDRATPSNRAERILLIGHALHLKGEVDFTGQVVNDELKNLGDGAPNITDAMSSLMAQRPALVRQTRRTGRGRAARKRYALTEAGRATVARMMNRARTEEEER